MAMNPDSRVVPIRGTATTATRGGDRPLRIIYVVSMFPAWSETFIVREIHSLLEQGVDVRIVSLRHPRKTLVQDDAASLAGRVIYPSSTVAGARLLLRQLRGAGMRSLRHPLLILKGMWKTPLAMAKTLVAWFRGMGMLEAIRRFEPDHIHAHWATYPSSAAMVMADHLGTSFSLTAHAHDIFLENHLMEEKLRAAAFIATISKYNRRYLEARYPAAAHADIRIIHCGVPRESAPFRPSRIERHPPLVLSVGRHDPVKGFPALLAACRILKERGCFFRCEIIGDGPLRKSLERAIVQQGLEEIVALLGVQPSTVVERKLAAADIFVLASQRAPNGNMDGIPVALMEAMACGTPVISTQVSGIPELVEDGRTGLLVPPADTGALADAIERMLADGVLRKRCVAGARIKIENEFDVSIEASRLLALFRTHAGRNNAKKIADHH